MWDIESKSPSVWRLLFGASNQIKEHIEGYTDSEVRAYQEDKF